MYNLEEFHSEGFSFFHDHKAGLIVKFAGKLLFLTGVHTYDYKDEKEMYHEALEIFSEWVAYCIYTNDVETAPKLAT